MAAIDQQQVLSANLVGVYIKGKQVGRAQSIRSNRSFGTTGIYEIGSIMPQESAALKFEGSVTLSRFRLRKNDLVQAGIVSLGADILKVPVFDIVIKDSTGQVLEAYMGCSLVSSNTEISANEIISEEAEFTYLWAEGRNKSGKERGQLSQVIS